MREPVWNTWLSTPQVEFPHLFIQFQWEISPIKTR